MSGKEEFIEIEGKIIDVMPNATFKVKVDGYEDMYVTATPSGKIRLRNIRLTRGDQVKLEMSPYDMNRARITYRIR
jgi:translation initiation factor IF-1